METSSIASNDPNIVNLFMQAPAMVCIMVGRECRCILSNPLFSKLFGGRDLVGMTAREVAPELEGQGYFEMLESVYDTGKPVYGNEYPGVADWNDDGNLTQKYFNFVYTPYRVEDKIAGVMIFGFEVTEQVLARQEVEKSQKRMKAMLEALPQMAWTAKATGEVDYYNFGWYAYTGQTPEEALGSGWANIMHVDDVSAMISDWSVSVETGKVFERECRYRRKDGVYRWHLTRGIPIRDEQGAIIFWTGSCTDIHDQKMQTEILERIIQQRTSELQSMNIDLKRSNDELEQFASAASHDLKEPLRKIQVFSDMLQSSNMQNSTMYIGRIRDASNRMMALVDDLLEFSRIRREPRLFEQVNLNEVLDEVKQDLDLLIAEKSATISADSLPTVKAIPRQMQQLFYNLINNALKYSKKDVSPQITIQASATDPAEVARFPLLNPESAYYTISVADNGIGFDPADTDKVFAIFQRLHSRDSYSGTGVGLALCKKVVHNHGGEIYATSEPGKGSTFYIILPE